MDLLDSKNVNNRIKKRTVATAVLVHLYLTIVTLGFWLIPLTLFGIVTSSLWRNDIDEAKSSLKDEGRYQSFGNGNDWQSGRGCR